MSVKRTASADLDKASTRTISGLGLFAARAAVIAAGGVAALTIGTWAAVTFGVTLPPVLFAAALRSARRRRPATTTNPPTLGSDEPSVNSARTRARQEVSGSHSGITGPDELAAGDPSTWHGFDCPMCDYPWTTEAGCGFCGWERGESIGFAGIEFDAPERITPTADDVQRTACPVCDWKPADGCIHLDGTNDEHGQCFEPWCQFCTWKPGDECPNCTYPTPPMKAAKCITDNMTPDERDAFQESLLAYHRTITADGPVTASALSEDERLWLDELGHVDTGDPDRHERRRVLARLWIWKYLVHHVAHVRHA